MPPTKKNTGLTLFLQAAVAGLPAHLGRAPRTELDHLRDRVPLINTSAFVFLYRALHAPEAYVGFVILGATMATYWLNILWMMASQLYWDKQGGFLELFVLAPVSLMALLLGMGVGGLYRSTLRAATIAVVGTLRVRRAVRWRPMGPGAAGLRRDHVRALRAGHGAQFGLPDVGPGSLAGLAGPDRAGLLPDRDELPAGQIVHRPSPAC